MRKRSGRFCDSEMCAAQGSEAEDGAQARGMRK